MRVPHAVSAAALIAIAAAAACSGGQSTNYVAPPATSGAISTGGAVVLSQSATVQSIGTANGITGALTFGSGSGTVTSVSSATAPFGTTTVVPAAKQRIVLAAATSSPTSPNVYYVAISSSTGASLAGLPGVSLSFATPAVGTYQEAEWNGTAYVNVPGAAAAVNAAETAVSFPAGATAVTIPANGSIYLAFYQGTYPNATPAPVAIPTNVIADSGFEGTAAAYGAPISKTGWTQCAILAAAPGVTNVVHPLVSPSYPPTPGTTPGAFIEASGTAITQGTATPVPTVTSVSVVSGNQAAVFGGVFSTYNQADFGFNGLCQTVTIPNNATISMSLLGSGNEASNYVDYDVNVLDLTGKYLGNLYDEQVVTATSAGDTAYRSVTVPATKIAPYAGQTVELFVGIWTKSGSSTGSTKYSGYYFLDNFMLAGTF